MDLIHPGTKADVIEAVMAAAADGSRLLPVGGRRHIDKGNPCEIDAELWTTQLDQVVAYEPAEMIAVVEGGMRCGDLDRVLAEHAQEWPADAPADATVAGVIASAASSPRRLRTGPLRDTVLEVELVTGDGRLVRGGARVVKNVTGYDLPRVVAGSLGTLGVIVQVALKLRPRPKRTATLAWATARPFAVADDLLTALTQPAAVLVQPSSVVVRLEGWPEEVAVQTDTAIAVAGDPVSVANEAPFSGDDIPSFTTPVTAEAAVPPAALEELASFAGDTWTALAGVGLLWVGLPDDGLELADLRVRAAEHGGIVPVIRGPGGLGATPPAPQVHRRLRDAFDPAGILAPGRFWGEEA